MKNIYRIDFPAVNFVCGLLQIFYLMDTTHRMRLHFIVLLFIITSGVRYTDTKIMGLAICRVKTKRLFVSTECCGVPFFRMTLVHGGERELNFSVNPINKFPLGRTSYHKQSIQGNRYRNDIFGGVKNKVPGSQHNVLP